MVVMMFFYIFDNAFLLYYVNNSLRVRRINILLTLTLKVIY